MIDSPLPIILQVASPHQRLTYTYLLANQFAGPQGLLTLPLLYRFLDEPPVRRAIPSWHLLRPLESRAISVSLYASLRTFHVPLPYSQHLPYRAGESGELLRPGSTPTLYELRMLAQGWNELLQSLPGLVPPRAPGEGSWWHHRTAAVQGLGCIRQEHPPWIRACGFSVCDRRSV